MNNCKTCIIWNDSDWPRNSPFTKGSLCSTFLLCSASIWLHGMQEVTISHYLMRLDSTSHRGGIVQLKDAEGIVVLETCAGISGLVALLVWASPWETQSVSADASYRQALGLCSASAYLTAHRLGKICFRPLGTPNSLIQLGHDTVLVVLMQEWSAGFNHANLEGGHDGVWWGI